MCTVLLPPGDNPIAVNKYINIIHLIGQTIISEPREGVCVCGMFKKNLVSVIKQRTNQSSTENSYPLFHGEPESMHIILLMNRDFK